MEITERLIRRIARQEFGQMAKSGAYTRGTGGGGSYTLPVAADGTLGGVQLGYPTSAANRYYAVQLDSSQRAYVNVPWTDHYAWSDITDKPTTATRWPSWGEVTSKPTSKTVWGKTYLNASSEFQNISGDMSSVGHIGFLGDDSYDLGSSTVRMRSGYFGTSVLVNAVEIGHTNEINATGGNTLYLQYRNSGNLVLCYNGQNVGIGDANPAYKLEVAGNCRISSKLLVATTDSTYELNVGGAIHAQNGYAEGTWASKSDARMKNVEGDVDLTVEQIAAMPAVKFTWKNDPEKRVHVGTLAQPWQKVLPEAIETAQADTLMMCYGEAAMVSVIKLAQRVLELERMIKEK